MSFLSDFNKREEYYPPSKKKALAFWVFFFLVSFAGLILIFANNWDQLAVNYSSVIFMMMMVVVAIISALEIAMPRGLFIADIPWDNPKTRWWATLAGISFTMIILAISVSLSISLPAQSVSVNGAIFNGFYAPFFETAFIFTCMIPTGGRVLNRFLRPKLGYIVAALIFIPIWAFSHIKNLSTDPTMYPWGALFTIIAIGAIYFLGNHLFKDKAFAFSAHLTNNIGLMLLGAIGVVMH